ncbi:ExeA family protein [Arhodomonas sp. SL1]|uniref:ExeA family protein n=1 Tax=Arhodomonas sp. SL1 TaxID=3425691 RepID=UPI003F881F37
MFERYYGLAEDPFRLTPDPSFCYAHRSFRKARSYLEYGIQRAEGFVMVTGEPGSGKTTLLESLLAEADLEDVHVVRLLSSRVEGDELVRLLAYELGVAADGRGKASLLRASLHKLDAEHQRGRRTVLLVDEAQGLSESALEELRFLTNMQKNNRPLVQVFLLGQPGLREMLQRPSLEQLQQRLIAACHLAPLSVEETRAYVEHRLALVGWHPGQPTIDERLYTAVNVAAGGIPRRINQVMSRLLMHGFVEGTRHLAPEDMRAVLCELAEDRLLPTGCDVDWVMGQMAVRAGPTPRPTMATAPPPVYVDHRPTPRAPDGSRLAGRVVPLSGRRRHRVLGWATAAALGVAVIGGGAWWAVNARVGLPDAIGTEVARWLSWPMSGQAPAGRHVSGGGS